MDRENLEAKGKTELLWVSLDKRGTILTEGLRVK